MKAWYAPGSVLAFALGFVLVPVLAGLLSHIAQPKDYGKRVSALASARLLANLLDQYRADQMRLPKADEGLGVLVPTYLDHLPLDPWGHPFVYTVGNDILWADVLSYGSDGQSGGSNDAGDISARFGPLTPSRPWIVQALEGLVAFMVPLIAFACANRWTFARDVFAGSAALYGVLLLALVGNSIDAFALIPIALAIACLANSIHLFTRPEGGVLVTGIAVIIAHTLLAVLVTQ